MAKVTKRIIHSSTRRSQDFVALDWMARDLWHGMIAVADDQGRMIGLSASVRSEVWPLDDVSLSEVDNCINQLVAKGMIVVYQVENKVIIQIVNWWIYQQKQWAPPSDLAPHPGWVDRIRYHGAGHKVITENWKQPGGFGPDGIPPNQVVDQVENQAEPYDNDNDNDNDSEEDHEQPAWPVNLAGWHERLKESNNKPAELMSMIQTLMPDLVEFPEFGYIGKTAKTVGGAGRLATLIWQASSQNVTGDLMAYCQAMVKGKDSQQQPKGFDGLKQFAEEQL